MQCGFQTWFPEPDTKQLSMFKTLQHRRDTWWGRHHASACTHINWEWTKSNYKSSLVIYAAYTWAQTSWESNPKKASSKLTPSTSSLGPHNSLETTAKSELECACSCACTPNDKNVLAPFISHTKSKCSLYHFLRSPSKDCPTLKNHSPCLLSSFMLLCFCSFMKQKLVTEI